MKVFKLLCIFLLLPLLSFGQDIAENGQIKLNDGTIIKGSVTFDKNSFGEIDLVLVATATSDKKEYKISEIKGGVVNDLRFLRVDTRMGDLLYQIVGSEGDWNIIKPIEEKGNSMLGIGNIKTEKSYDFSTVMNINKKLASLFKSCPVVVQGAKSKKYGRKLADFVALISDLADCE